MFRRLKGLVKGPKKSHTNEITHPHNASDVQQFQSNDKKPSNKRVNYKLRNGNSPTHVDQRVSRNFDEFTRNDSVEFDIIPTASVNVTNNGNNGEVKPCSTSEYNEPDDSTNDEEIEEFLPKIEHLTGPGRIADSCTSDEEDIKVKNTDSDSINDKIQEEEEEEEEEDKDENALSMDEKETLDMLDGILNEALEFDVADTEEGELDGDDVIVTNSEYTQIDDVIIDHVERKEGKPIDYDKVLGDSNDSCETSSADSKNWQLSYGDPNRQSHWKLIPKSAIYLPSTEEKSSESEVISSLAPELPPADYSDLENEEEDDTSVVLEPIITSFSAVRHNDDVEDVVTFDSPKPVVQSPVITGFSSRVIPPNENSNNSRESACRSNTVSSSSSDYAKTTISSSNSSRRSSEFSNDVIIVDSLPPPRCTKIRVTSFRKNIGTLSLSGKPVNDLVKKFETLSVQAVEF